MSHMPPHDSVAVRRRQLATQRMGRKSLIFLPSEAGKEGFFL
jgi:hypothetical protein